MDKKPTGYVCYLCGAQFGSRSLHIHLKSCQKKWVQVEEQKPKREQRRLPDPPPGVDLVNLPTTPNEVQEFNSFMFNYFDKISLVKCSTCSRTFRPDALERHAKSCSGGGGGGGSKPQSSGGGGGGMGGGGGNYESRPKAYVCFLCGCQYGSQSLKIHIPKCEEKFVKVESQKQKSERRPLPMRPAELDDPLPKNSQDIDEFNNKMFSYYNGVSLVKCQKCGRTFNSEALVKHAKGCKGAAPPKESSRPSTANSTQQPKNTTTNAQAANNRKDNADFKSSGAGKSDPGGQTQASVYPEYDAPDESDDQAREQCPDCGRSFNPETLARHVKICKKVFASKRKTFNSASNRVQGTDAQQYFNPRKKETKSSAGKLQKPEESNPKWKQQSESLRQAMSSQRKIQQALARGEDIRNIPHVPSAPDPSLILCPHCGRRFNEKAAERHIPSCATTVSKPSFLKAGAKTRGGRY
eukprot:TRINITY_DN5041_c0_g2_i3.p1 TRINITY_DN5041_c0_g2~~TRINITY_DN5041_c0_g2_i3.p1  ORF type:complete len:467 (-),score=81.56 TRINITY_DN5041_c0_g2_i3:1644-3044(-)